MRKKIIFLLIVFIVFFTAGLFYINKYYLPLKVRSVLISGLENNTQKSVSLGSLYLNIFKGLVLRDLKLYDQAGPAIEIEEVSCNFFLIPFLRKQIIIPFARIKSPKIFLVRHKDNTYNLASFFAQKPNEDKSAMQLFAYRVVVSDAQIFFRDETFEPPLSRKINDLDLSISLSLPKSIKFAFKLQLDSQKNTKIKGRGRYIFTDSALDIEALITDLFPVEFSAYFNSRPFRITGGLLNGKLKLGLMDNLLSINTETEANNFSFEKEQTSFESDSLIRLFFQYGLKSKMLNYSGEAAVRRLDIFNLAPLGNISQIRGDFRFDTSSLESENIKANLFSMPIEAKLKLSDFKNPQIKAEFKAQDTQLEMIKEVLERKEISGVNLPQLKGKADLFIILESGFPLSKESKIKGDFEIKDAEARFKEPDIYLKDISGEINLANDLLSWKNFSFNFSDTDFKSSGILKNFDAPAVDFELLSSDLKLNSVLGIEKKVVKLNKFKGAFSESLFDIKGSVDFSEKPQIKSDLKADLNLELKDLNKIPSKIKQNIIKMKPEGKVKIHAGLEGDLRLPKECFLSAQCSSSQISLYGLKGQNFNAKILQDNNLLKLYPLEIDFYGGKISSESSMNLLSENLSFLCDLKFENVKLGELKADTTLKNEKFSGTLNASARLNGSFADSDKLKGLGEIVITDGNLWELNLFKGLGVLLFSKNFTKIPFGNAKCTFLVENKHIYTEDLKMESSLANLSGKMDIGFDGSLDSSLDVEVTTDAPLTGTFKDVTTAIMGKAGRFGVIRITGTLKEPKYKFKTAVVDIIKGIKDMFLNR